MRRLRAQQYLQNLPSRVKNSVKASVAVIEQGERRVRSPVVALMSLEV